MAAEARNCSTDYECDRLGPGLAQGVNPLPASYRYLKPYYLDPDKSYFMQLAK